MGQAEVVHLARAFHTELGLGCLSETKQHIVIPLSPGATCASPQEFLHACVVLHMHTPKNRRTDEELAASRVRLECKMCQAFLLLFCDGTLRIGL